MCVCVHAVCHGVHVCVFACVRERECVYVCTFARSRVGMCVRVCTCVYACMNI